ncbi:MAG TPA: carboxypeptidase-like regulatory domain-containing protein, partial [Flavobacterium sp.]|uniref:carboxypeptidase-like regulatory domain-containing protein n=1 Tax=Flavobacterium sp. TaxID=239 RepID=UPI002C374191
MKNTFTLVLCLFSVFSFAQIRGRVTDEKGNPLPFVNIFEENTYNSTTSNDQGKFELNIKIPGNHIILFQYLGYKTGKQIVQLTNNIPATVDVVLQEENITLKEVVINTNENPANEIIRNAIKNKKENSEKTARFKADFYSRGIIRLKDAPKTIMGQKFD